MFPGQLLSLSKWLSLVGFKNFVTDLRGLNLVVDNLCKPCVRIESCGWGVCSGPGVQGFGYIVSLVCVGDEWCEVCSGGTHHPRPQGASENQVGCPAWRRETSHVSTRMHIIVAIIITTTTTIIIINPLTVRVLRVPQMTLQPVFPILWDLPNSRSVDSVMSCHVLHLHSLCRLVLPALLPFTLHCKTVLARPDEWKYDLLLQVVSPYEHSCTHTHIGANILHTVSGMHIPVNEHTYTHLNEHIVYMCTHSDWTHV